MFRKAVLLILSCDMEERKTDLILAEASFSCADSYAVVRQHYYFLLKDFVFIHQKSKQLLYFSF